MEWNPIKLLLYDVLVGNPSAFEPALAYRLRTAQPTLTDDPIYFNIIYYSNINVCVPQFLWPLPFGWLVVLSVFKEDYLQIFKCVFFWLHGFCG